MKCFLRTLPMMCACLLAASCAGKMPHKVHRHDIRVVMKTTKGDIVLNLYTKRLPEACVNFLALADAGFYNGMTFYDASSEFLKAGRETPAAISTGTGNSSGTAYAEFRVQLEHDRPGVLVMAHSEKDAENSRFFVAQRTQAGLGAKRPSFGEVMRGQSVIEQIEPGDKMVKVTVVDNPAELFAQHPEQVDSVRKRMYARKAALEAEKK